ncbi:tetratricopeptide repeat protein 34-like [Thalassophryne amazonica]|uniref:tetratricopeptide repeat protein 34-like n=1 Tax=Thalassophryne amazonica TaxID=390379 RepID=UPI00147095A8|nr:tetratricopeptide repeat protein 34-like [Thalassophryne amazonica]
MYSVILQQSHSQQETGSSAEKSIKETLERRARLLTARAAACFSAGDRTLEACQDLGKAFQINPATTQVYFQKLFTDKGTGMAARNHLCQQAERGLSGYRERVTSRPDLRSTDGVELLDPVITQLRTLCHLEPDGGGRELRVRLTDCLLLRGEHKEALSICGQLAASKGQQSYQNTVRVLRGYARLLSDDHKGALEDFQAVIGHSAPHPSSCVRALCGRGLLRMLSSSYYLAALDYVTASRLQPREAALTVRCLVPWNCRGLLFTCLLEQGRVMLEGMKEKQPTCSTDEHSHLHLGEDQLQPPSKRDTNRTGYDGAPAYTHAAKPDFIERFCPWSCAKLLSFHLRTPAGVQSLAALLMELQPSADGAQILAADALYQLGRVEEAYRLLLAVGPTSPRAPILARLTLLQLHRGFLYDTNQVCKCRLESLNVEPRDANTWHNRRTGPFCRDTVTLLQNASWMAQWKRALSGRRVAYLSIAIMASGGEAADSLLERARCYALLGQRKTAIFDFSTILKENPKHVQALCGRGFTYLMLNQQKECTEDILVALHINSNTVTKDILSLKDKAQKLVCDWMHQLCRSKLSDVLVANAVPCQEEQLRETLWHLLHVDILLAKENESSSCSPGTGVWPGAQGWRGPGRVGVVEAWQQNYHSAAHRFSKLIEKDPSSLEFLLDLIPLNQQKRVAQAAAQEASSMSSGGQWDLALPLLTVAVQVTGNHKLQYLRQRAACLAQLGLHEQAVADLDRVIQKHSRCESSCSEDACIQAEDLCRRGRSHVLCSRQGLAVEDFSRALELHRDQAIRCIEAGLGRQHVSECFLRGALQQYGEQQLSKAWAMIESGLLVDGENTELRGLRAKVKREVSSPCIVG